MSIQEARIIGLHFPLSVTTWLCNAFVVVTKHKNGRASQMLYTSLILSNHLWNVSGFIMSIFLSNTFINSLIVPLLNAIHILGTSQDYYSQKDLHIFTSSEYMLMTLYIIRTKFKQGPIIICFEIFHIAISIPAPLKYISNTCRTTTIKLIITSGPDNKYSL